MNTLQIVLVVVSILVLWLILAYNRLIVLRNRSREAWSDIDVQLKRRYDLIPNLVETVRGYAGHEKSVFEEVTLARARAMGAGTVKERENAENFLAGTLKNLFALSENYPQLRASENFQKLQDELTDTEDKIQAARRFYNTNIMALNTKIESFPVNFIAGTFGFKKMEFFGTETESKEPVKVKF